MKKKNISLTEEEKDIDLIADIFSKPEPPSEDEADAEYRADANRIKEISKKYSSLKWLKILWKAYWKAAKEKTK